MPAHNAGTQRRHTTPAHNASSQVIGGMTAGKAQMTNLPDYVIENRELWNEQAASYRAAGREHWSGEPAWGVWSVPESQLRVLPDDMTGLDCIELGCGTAYVSAWLARRGGRPVGIDNSPEQLATARALQAEFGIDFPLHLGNAEATPFPDASFDFAISEYGAAIWCDPFKWIPEAFRLLRPGGQLVFLGQSTLMMLTLPELDNTAASDRLVRSQRGMHRFEWSDTKGIEFHLSPGDWIRLLRRSGFEIEDLIELYPADGSTSLYPYATLEWSQRWPCEEIWKLRKRHG
jgi:SAM-dependent methyltransferase